MVHQIQHYEQPKIYKQRIASYRTVQIWDTNSLAYPCNVSHILYIL